MYISFCRYSGPYELDDRAPTKASTALAVGDALIEDTGLSVAVSDGEIQGIALQAKAVGVTAQTPIMVLQILPRAKFYGAAESGTFVTATDGNTFVDLASADGLAADTSTNDDWLVKFVLSSSEAVGQFTHLATTFR